MDWNVIKLDPNSIVNIPTERLTDDMIREVFFKCNVSTLKWIHNYILCFNKHIYSDQFIIDYINRKRRSEFNDFR